MNYELYGLRINAKLIMLSDESVAIFMFKIYTELIMFLGIADILLLVIVNKYSF